MDPEPLEGLTRRAQARDLEAFLTSRSRLLESGALPPAHRDAADAVRGALGLLAADPPGALSAREAVARQRADKLRRYFAQPYFCAEPYTKQPGRRVPLATALRDCRAILDGEVDDLPVEAVYFTGSLEDVRRTARGGTA